MTLFDSFILGVVEGITEFLPVSSTAHLVLTSQLLELQQDEFMRSFEIIIQMAPIFSVIFLFWSRLFASKELWFKLGVSFFPTGAIGFLFHDYIESLFTADSTIFWIVVTGLLFIGFELFHSDEKFKVDDEEKISYLQAFSIGLFQSIALIPGVSRSGSTILGAMALGLSREVAMRFSFLLAIPTMGIASLYTIYKSGDSLTVDNLELLGVGFIVSFLFGIIAIKTFLEIVSRYRFIPFGVYLILTAVVFYFLT
jgi:undecaprenyl-diphosphatase